MSYSRPPMPLPRPSNESNIFSNARISSNLQIPNIFISNKQTPTPNPTNHNGSFPLPTNNHLTSLLVPSENAVPSYVQPFLYTLLPDAQGVKSIIAISSAHVDQKVIGDHYAYNPVGIHELTINNLGQCDVSSDGVVFPKGRVGLIQGQGMVTVELTSAEGVRLDSAVGIRNVYDVKGGEGRCFGIELNSGRKWIVYVEGLSLNVERDGNTGMYKMNVVGHEGIVQLYPDTDPRYSLLGMDFNGLGNLLKLGNYARSLTVSTASGSKDVLQFDYDMRYKDRDGLIFLLPHHQSDVIAQTAVKADLKLYSTVYGYMQGYYTKGTVSFDYSRPEDDLSDYDILSESKQSIFHQKLNTFLDNLSPIKDILINNDISECMNNLQNESNLDSMYFSGKIFNKYAWLLFIAEELLHDTELSNKLFTKITECLNKFIQNQQILPLLYDQKWGGIISSGDMGQDFGNSMYNDHHFHYGYFVLTFAILGWYNPKWFEENRFYSDLLLRDYCNIDDNDKAFTKFRNFSWFEGHSWANGVWPSLDGRDQESSSEDYNSVYAMYLYGSMTNNEKMKQIAKLQLNIMKRSNNAYFLYKDRDLNNEVAIAEMKKNKVCGIFFQNKIDYATYFGLNTEYIHMIHFIPGTFITRYIRDNEFVTEEWNQKLQNINIDNNGWNGLMKLNRALISPDTIDFFKNPNFNKANLDNGQSQTLSLILALLWNN